MDMEVAQSVLGVAIGLGLSAACGFRVFVPLLALGLAGHTGQLALSPGFAWLGTTPALVALGTATVLEIGAYYVPWIDNLLDLVATPAAVAAGVLTSASVIVDLPPMVRWGIALIGGGGVAGLVQGATVLLRVKSAALTGGVGNPVVSTMELVGSVITAILAIVLPVLCLIMIVVLCVAICRAAGRIGFGRRAAAP